jgi:hypothetical protein
MSIDVMILPGRKLELVPGLFLGQLGLERRSPAAALIGETPALLKLDSREIVATDGTLEPGRAYAFHLAAENTLTISIGLSTDFDEEEYVEDYGGNLSPEERATIIEAWRQAGPGLTLSSGGGAPQANSSFSRRSLGAALAPCQDGSASRAGPSSTRGPASALPSSSRGSNID